VIAVCGEALMDVVRHGSQAQHPGGGPFNTARALARLGVPVAFVGRLSDDHLGVELRRCLAADGVDLSMAVVGPEPTTVALAEVDEAGIASYRFKFAGTSAPNLTADMLPARLPIEVEALHVGSLGLLLEPMAATISELVRREGAGRPIMIDPNIRAPTIDDPRTYRRRLDSVMAQSTIVKAAESDVAWLAPTASVEDFAASVLRQTGARLVVVTLGAAGAFGVTDRARAHVVAPQLPVVDTIGAGDAFGAALLGWLHDRGLLVKDLSLGARELEDVLAFACMVASMTCAQAGANTPRRSELNLA